MATTGDRLEDLPEMTWRRGGAMTTRRSEPIETERVSVEDILRPLAERTVMCLHLRVHRGVREVCLDCGQNHEIWVIETPEASWASRPVLDKRFEALRTGDYVDTFHHFRGIDASLGAIRTAMVACGWNMLWLTTYGDVVVAELWASAQSKCAGVGKGATDTEAAAKALIAAVCKGYLREGHDTEHTLREEP